MTPNNNIIKRLLSVNITLIPLVVLLLISGLAFHRAADLGIADQSIWPGVHLTIVAILITTIGLHIYFNWGWFKSFTKKFRAKSKTTYLLVLLLAFEMVTGLLILINTNNIGLFHYITGIVICIAITVHVVMRFEWIRNNAKKLNQK